MSDERVPPDSPSGNGSGDDEDTTVVEVSRDFIIRSLGRAADALYRAGDLCLGARAMVTRGDDAHVLHDLVEKLPDLADIIKGSARALANLEFKENK